MASDGPSLGEELLAKGWKQGCLLPENAPVLFLERVPGPPPGWKRSERNTKGVLVLATQTCTLKNAHDEPMVEFRRAFWTDKKSVIASAKPNSNRACILHSRRRWPHLRREELPLADRTRAGVLR